MGTVEMAGKVWKIGPRVSQAVVKAFFPKCRVAAIGLGIFEYIA
ncbi:hypothetical protein [Telmatocola sphagniphila]|nr:hypothetical protein [Telmatocola sphagniphila]